MRIRIQMNQQLLAESRALAAQHGQSLASLIRQSLWGAIRKARVMEELTPPLECQRFNAGETSTVAMSLDDYERWGDAWLHASRPRQQPRAYFRRIPFNSDRRDHASACSPRSVRPKRGWPAREMV
jgi:hypothetical protein